MVVCDADKVVGHVMFTVNLLDAPARLVPVHVLSPLGVLPAWQGRGAGTALVHEGMELLRERGVPVVFVEGPPQYYSRFGFAAGAEQGFRKPSLRIPDAAFQAIRLPAHEEWMTGTLVIPRCSGDTMPLGYATLCRHGTEPRDRALTTSLVTRGIRRLPHRCFPP